MRPFFLCRAVGEGSAARQCDRSDSAGQCGRAMRPEQFDRSIAAGAIRPERNSASCAGGRGREAACGGAEGRSAAKRRAARGGLGETCCSSGGLPQRFEEAPRCGLRRHPQRFEEAAPQRFEEAPRGAGTKKFPELNAPGISVIGSRSFQTATGMLSPASGRQPPATCPLRYP